MDKYQELKQAGQSIGNSPINQGTNAACCRVQTVGEALDNHIQGLRNEACRLETLKNSLAGSYLALPADQFYPKT